MSSVKRLYSAVLRIVVLFTFLARDVTSFTFTYGPPTQCHPFTISWTGGTAPFSLLLTPVFDNPRNFSIPPSAVNPSSGSYTVQLPLAAGQQFIVAMSDATGFGTGGVSDILTVGSSISRASCSTQMPPPGFQFQLDSQLQQCAPYNVSGYTGASQPITITGLIPLGTPLQLHPSTGPPWFVWDPANVPAGTTVVFFLTDAAGHFGGSSHVNQVGASGNSSCINAQSPMSTANSASGGPIATGAAASPTTSAPAATVTPGSRRVSAATIGSAVAGALVALLILGTLLAFFFRQYFPQKGSASTMLSQRFSSGSRHHGRVPSIGLHQPNSANPPNQTPPNRFGAQDMPQSQWTTFHVSPDNDYLARPYTVPPSATGDSFTAAATENGQHEYRSDIVPPLVHMEPSATQTGHASKASMGLPSRRPTRLILHTHAEEELELPPRYADRSGRSDLHS